MYGFASIGEDTVSLDLHPGPRLADGRAVALSDAGLMIGGQLHPATYVRAGSTVWVHLDGRTYEIGLSDAVDHLAGDAESASGGAVKAPMPGVVVQVLVTEGMTVAANDPVMVIESMKLETTIRAPRDGTVETVHVVAGATFERDASLLTLAAEA